ncbi:MAG: UDP-N-acetylmuramoyl-L-alanyl-D-glutamate--2,6-diaminopimelate ligase [Armatimonadota bacterium]
MLLSKLIEPIIGKKKYGLSDPDINTIAYDSRKVVSGSVFVCIRGENFDGHQFISNAINNGASAVIADSECIIDAEKLKIPYVLVPDSRTVLPVIANRLFDYPSKKLKLTGITGTKGKTTTSFLVNAILKQSGLKTGVIGTMGTWINDVPAPSNRTTPESVDLQQLFVDMLAESVSAVSMEVSSHALVKHRTSGCEFDTAVFTNLTHEHLDFHNTLEEYFLAKLTLFKQYPLMSSKPFTAVVNIDDPRGSAVCANTAGRTITYGISNHADITASNVIARASGVSFDVSSAHGDFHIDLKLGGVFNVYNALAAIGTAFSYGIEIDDIIDGLQSVNAVDGRFEAVKCGQDFDVIVDYAHTPDSLINVLRAAREITKGRLIVVFGCGGNRDKAKRSIMGNIASEMADVCIITSDNPRKEDPDTIISEIVSGIHKDHCHKFEIIPDRLKAIQRAIEIARPHDMLVIAGKGHETYQEFADHTIHFDDREVVRDILSSVKESV